MRKKRKEWSGTRRGSLEQVSLEQMRSKRVEWEKKRIKRMRKKGLEWEQK